jgi:hypothetical protein
MLSDGKQAREAAKDIGEKVADVGVKLECVDEKVQVVIDGTQGSSSELLSPPTSIPSDGKQTRAAAQETSLFIQQVANDIDKIKCSRYLNFAIACSSCS